MAHFARIDRNNVVKSVHVVDNEHLINEQGEEEEDFGIVYLNKIHGVGFTWVQISYNSNFRKQYAGIGYTYDKTNDVFIQPQPSKSYTLNASFDWEEPAGKPDDDKHYEWNEDTEAWDETE